jgi:hypothetical protein
VGLIKQAPTINNHHGGLDKSSPYRNLGGFNKSYYDADLLF